MVLAPPGFEGGTEAMKTVAPAARAVRIIVCRPASAWRHAARYRAPQVVGALHQQDHLCSGRRQHLRQSAWRLRPPTRVAAPALVTTNCAAWVT